MVYQFNYHVLNNFHFYSSFIFTNKSSNILDTGLYWKILAYHQRRKCTISVRTISQWLTGNNSTVHLSVLCQGAYIKYVAGGGRRVYKFFKKYFVAQESIDLNISWSSNFFRKYFMAPPINFSFLFKAYLQQCFRVVLSNIQTSNHQIS